MRELALYAKKRGVDGIPGDRGSRGTVEIVVKSAARARK